MNIDRPAAMKIRRMSERGTSPRHLLQFSAAGLTITCPLSRLSLYSLKKDVTLLTVFTDFFLFPYAITWSRTFGEAVITHLKDKFQLKRKNRWTYTAMMPLLILEFTMQESCVYVHVRKSKQIIIYLGASYFSGLN